MKSSNEMYQNLPCFWNTKTYVDLLNFITYYYFFVFPNNVLVYVDDDQSIHQGKIKYQHEKKIKIIFAFFGHI